MTGPSTPARSTRTSSRRTSSSRASSARDSSVGGDVVSLSQRVAGTAVLRLVVATVVIALGATGGTSGIGRAALTAVVYVATASLGNAVVMLMPDRRRALFVFGLLLSADAVMVQAAVYLLGSELAGDLLLGIFGSAVCLLASFRTGIRIAVWQTLILVCTAKGAVTGLISDLPMTSDQRLSSQITLMWLMVMVVCAAAAVNERELRRRRYDAEALQHFATALHRDDDPDLVLDRLVEFAVNQFDAGRVLVCGTVNGATTVMRQWRAPEAASLAPAPHLPVLLGLAAAAGTPVLVLTVDPDADPWLAQALPGARRLVTAALRAEESDVVWLLFEHRGRGSRVERRVVSTVRQAVTIASLALSRAQFLQRSRVFALTDGLTGLANRRAFDQRIEHLAAPDATTRFAVVLVDVDHFKSVNDVHGHQVGDEVLQIVAGVLAAAAPPDAVVARYGGEEFVALLPGADARAAAVVAERMRARLEVTPVPQMSVDSRPAHVTASFGVAATKAGATDPATLLAAADRALYQAKHTGRNRIGWARPASPPTPRTEPSGAPSATAVPVHDRPR